MEPYIVTLTGKRISRTAGIPSVGDIAVSLCRTPMFAGATKLPYSVAHHCVAAAEIADAAGESARTVWLTLMHESEVVAFGDTPGPLKGAEQRKDERALRDRLFLVQAGEWDLVEFYDKVEQAAAAAWLGLGNDESVHAATWAKATPAVQRVATRLTVHAYHRYPPKDQLDVDSPLARQFMHMHDYYLNRISQR